MVLPQVRSEEIVEELPPSRIRILLTAFLGVFLIVLVIVWTFSDVLQGIVQSARVEGNVLDVHGQRFIFLNGTLEALQQEYVDNQDREIKACLFGEVNDSVYYIRGIEFPQIIRANVLHIVSIRCPADVLVDVHSHPVNKCLASEQDLSVYRELTGINPSLRMLVMCSRARFGSI